VVAVGHPFPPSVSRDQPPRVQQEKTHSVENLKNFRESNSDTYSREKRLLLAYATFGMYE